MGIREVRRVSLVPCSGIGARVHLIATFADEADTEFDCSFTRQSGSVRQGRSDVFGMQRRIAGQDVGSVSPRRVVVEYYGKQSPPCGGKRQGSR